MGKGKHGQGKKLQKDGEKNEGRNRSIVETHTHATDKPGNAEARIKNAKGGAAPFRRNGGGQHCLQARILRSHPNSPKNHPDELSLVRARRLGEQKKREHQRLREGWEGHLVQQFSKKQRSQRCCRHCYRIENRNKTWWNDCGFLEVKGNQREVSKSSGNQYSGRKITPIGS